MEWTGWMGWIVAAGFALATLVLYLQKSSNAPPASPPETGPRAADPPRTATDNATSGAHATAAARPDAAGEELAALRATLGYLRRAVLPDLAAARTHLPDAPTEARGLLEDALDAMEDLAFYAEPPPEERLEPDDLAQTVQEAVRQYTIETRVPVRVHPPEVALTVPLRREALKDAVFMLLANAGQFSEGRPIDVFLEALESGPGSTGFRIRVVDEGPGFTDEALAHALDPFWSTDPRGVGLGLPQARARVAAMKGSLSLRNASSGGGEVVVEVP